MKVIVHNDPDHGANSAIKLSCVLIVMDILL